VSKSSRLQRLTWNLQVLLPAHFAVDLLLHGFGRLRNIPGWVALIIVGLGALLAIPLAWRRIRLPWLAVTAGHWLLLFSDLGAVLGWLGHGDLVNSVRWNIYGFRDKRWVMLLYWGGVFSTLIWPWISCRWIENSPIKSQPLRLYGPPNWRPLAVCLLILFLLLGPPWVLSLSTESLNSHELVHLGPIQAVLTGKGFYTHAVTQYGPGLQWFTISHSVREFREAWSTLNFTGGLLLAICIGLVAPARWSWLAMVVTCLISPLGFYQFTPEGILTGFFGWANSWRYAPSLAITLAWPWVLLRSRRPLFFGAVLGLAWAAGSWMAQENLGNSVAACGLMLCLFLLTGHLTVARSWRPVMGVMAGFATGVTLILLPFALDGESALFVSRYFGVGGLVARGYSNTSFEGGPWRWMFYLVPFWAIGCAWIGLKTGRLAMIAPASALIASYANSLFRSDGPHLVATLSPLGIMIAVLVSDWNMPMLRRTRRALALALLLMVPLSTLTRIDVGGRLRSFGLTAKAYALPPGAAARLGLQLPPDAPFQASYKFKVSEYLALMDRLQEKIGARQVYVSSFPGRTGHVYFFARLTPLTDSPELTFTLVNSQLEQAELERLRSLRIPCLIWHDPKDPVVDVFRAQAATAPKAIQEWSFSSSEGPIQVACLP